LPKIIARLPPRLWLFFLLRLVCALFFAQLVINALFLSSYVIQTGTLTPTLEKGDRVFATPLLYGGSIPFTSYRLPPISAPKRGDLVVYRTASTPRRPWWRKILYEPYKFLTFGQSRRLPFISETIDAPAAIGRIVAVPGDTIKIENGNVFIRPAGGTQFLAEHSLTSKEYETTSQVFPENWSRELPVSGDLEAFLLPDEYFFILNDNRSILSDSRVWGPGHSSEIISKVLFSWWPRFSLK